VLVHRSLTAAGSVGSIHARHADVHARLADVKRLSGARRNSDGLRVYIGRESQPASGMVLAARDERPRALEEPGAAKRRLWLERDLQHARDPGVGKPAWENMPVLRRHGLENGPGK